MSNNPVGVFDSGIGGLTVVKEIIKTLLHENIIYLGDTARVPYGTRDKDIITKFALELTKFLLDKKVKILVVACNTISATCLDKIQEISPVPVIGVIKPTVYEAIMVKKAHIIGVIGTRATINSKIYEKEASILDKNVKVITQTCPLFVPLVEEGFIDHKATELIANDYFINFKDQKLDALILGCTHYPLLKNVIQKTIGKNVILIDSAKPVVNKLKKILEEKGLLGNNFSPRYKFYVTDAPQRVYQITNLFFDNKFPGKLEKVNI